MHKLRPVSDVLPRLQRLRDRAQEFRSGPEVRGAFRVTPTAPASRERAMDEESAWVVREALWSASLLLVNAEEHMLVFGKLLAEDFAATTLYGMARGVVETSAHAYWLTDPAVEHEERAARVYGWGIASEDEKRKLVRAVSKRADAEEPNEYEAQAIVKAQRLRDRRNARGLPRRENGSRVDRVRQLYQYRRPGTAPHGDDRDSGWHGVSLYRLYSAVMHGTPFSILALANADTVHQAGDGVVRAPVTRTNADDAFLLAGILTGYVAAARAWLAFTGQFVEDGPAPSSSFLWTPPRRSREVHEWLRLIESVALLVRPWLTQ